jgi:hypothetical protein
MLLYVNLCLQLLYRGTILLLRRRFWTISTVLWAVVALLDKRIIHAMAGHLLLPVWTGKNKGVTVNIPYTVTFFFLYTVER